MDLRNAKLGERYKVFVDAQNNLTEQTSQITKVATVIATKKVGAGMIGSLILGWKTAAEAVDNAPSRTGTNPTFWNYIPNQGLFHYGISVLPSHPVAERLLDDMDGCPCKKCLNFYPYAAPNQDDGTLICWSCRNTY